MAFLPVTYKCNQDCVFCSAERNAVAGGLKDWIKKADAMQEGLVQISGGEPLMLPEIELLALITHCGKKGRIIEFQTNATLINEKSGAFGNLIQKIKFFSGYFNVNCPAHNASLDRKITKLTGAFDQRKSGIKRILDSGVAVRLTHVINALNYAGLPDFVNFVGAELPGVSWIQFSFVKAIGRAEADAALVPEYETVSPHLIRALEMASRIGIKCEVDHIPMCFLGEFAELHVDAAKTSQGKSGPQVFEKKKTGACIQCRFSGVCPGPRTDYLRIYKRFSPSNLAKPEPKRLA